MIVSEVDLFLPALAKKKHSWRCLIFMASVLIAFNHNGQTAAGGEHTWLDENQVHQAMRKEAFRLLARKIDAVQNGTAEGFDYHIEQAYERIKNRLPAGPLSASELEAWLQQFLQPQKTSTGESELQTLIENFIKGMSLEIINTLQFECEQAEDLITQVAKLAIELEKGSRADQDSLDRALRQLGFSRKMSAIIRNLDRNWRVTPAGSDNFSAFSVLKKNMTGHNADKDQRLVFDLGERYRVRYPFLGQFMENYRRLAEVFRRAVLDLNASLDKGSDSP